jgi:hypothetical protein
MDRFMAAAINGFAANAELYRTCGLIRTEKGQFEPMHPDDFGVVVADFAIATVDVVIKRLSGPPEGEKVETPEASTEEAKTEAPSEGGAA